MEPDLGNDELTKPAFVTGPDEIYAAVRRCIADTLDMSAAQIMPNDSLLALGADSFHFVDLVFRLERTFQIRLDRGYALPDDHTVEAFGRAVAVALAAATNVYKAT
jgi:acyl carrier protein